MARSWVSSATDPGRTGISASANACVQAERDASGESIMVRVGGSGHARFIGTNRDMRNQVSPAVCAFALKTSTIHGKRIKWTKAMFAGSLVAAEQGFLQIGVHGLLTQPDLEHGLVEIVARDFNALGLAIDGYAQADAGDAGHVDDGAFFD